MSITHGKGLGAWQKNKNITFFFLSFFNFLTQNNVVLTHVCTHSLIQIISFLNPSSSSLSISLSQPMSNASIFASSTDNMKGLPLEIMISPVEAIIKTSYLKFVSHYQVLSRKSLNVKIRPQTNFLIITSNSLYTHNKNLTSTFITPCNCICIEFV